MKTLRRTQFGNPILRKVARTLTKDEILLDETQKLIANIRYTLAQKKLGVGLAAPQVGRSVALTVINVQPTEHRPNIEPFEAVLINPEVTKLVGRRSAMWEGCISSGSTGRADLFAKVPRYAEVKATFLDEQGKEHHKSFTGLPAQIVQHEVDHLNGVLFVDRVTDTKSYCTYSEYKKRLAKH